LAALAGFVAEEELTAIGERKQPLPPPRDAADLDDRRTGRFVHKSVLACADRLQQRFAESDWRGKPRFSTNIRFDRRRQFGIIVQELFGVFAALPDAHIAEAVEGAALRQHVVLHPEVDDVARTADPARLLEHDVELRLPEWRRHLVLHDL